MNIFWDFFFFSGGMRGQNLQLTFYIDLLGYIYANNRFIRYFHCFSLSPPPRSYFDYICSIKTSKTHTNMNLPIQRDEIKVVDAGDEENIIFEPPTLDVIRTEDRSDYLFYLVTRGNDRLNSALDSASRDEYESEIQLDQKTLQMNNVTSSPRIVEQLLNIEEKASQEDFVQYNYAKKVLEELNEKIKKTKDEIAKIKEEKEKIKNQMMND